MKTQEAIDIIQKHNDWRRGKPPYAGEVPEPMPVTPAELGKALEHAIQVMRESEWENIDTAPKDGTDVLAFEYPTIMVMYFNGYNWVQSDNQASEWSPDRQCPTHWMPLPEPPEGE